MKIIAIIVTYNRLELLKKCVKAIIAQSIKPNKIIVINNGSTDGTEEWLINQPVLTYTQQNNGGAAGFSTGIKLAYEQEADWIWLMDDDTIPSGNALEKLVSTIDQHPDKMNDIGFLSSLVLWKDGNVHEMNRTYVLKDEVKLKKLELSATHLPVIQFGTFVSMLLSSQAVNKIGLPIKEFFIWNDDVEYSKRIIDKGLAGILVKESIVVHETPINHLSNVFKDSHVNLWKYKYGLRNELYTKRSLEGTPQFWITWTHRIFIMPFRILINRKDHRWSFIKTIWKTSMEAISFRPKIETVRKKPVS